MLSMSAMSGGQAAYYLRLTREDYYLQPGEPEGCWWGRGAQALGLMHPVADDALRQLFRGFSPGGPALIQNAGSARHQPGWDLTFSAPKSVSVLWSQADERTRADIERAHRDAVSAALDYLEDEAAYSRRGRGGATLERAALVVARFEHAASRALDPQLHTHCLVLNVAVRPDGSTGTILSQPFYQHKMAAGALYRAALAEQLIRRLGLRLVPDGQAFAVAGVPRTLCDLFSQRRAAIEHRLAATGFHGPAAAAVAALATRQTKGIVTSRAELLARWQAVGAAHGFSSHELDRLLGRHVAAELERALDRALNGVLARLTRLATVFPARELLRRAAEATQALGVSALVLRTAVAQALGRLPAIVRLHDVKGQARYATLRLVRLEKELFKTGARLARTHAHGVSHAHVERVLARYHQPRSAVAEELRHHGRELLNALRKQPTTAPDRARIREQARFTLSAQQEAAVRRLTRARGASLRVLDGVTGTGKTTTLRVVREVLQRGGYTVIGTAPSGKAADALAWAAGIPSATLRKRELQLTPGWRHFVKHHARQLLRAARGLNSFPLDRLVLDRRTALIVDEAAQLGSRAMARLLRLVKRGGGLLILVGDRRQPQPIEAGRPFALLADRLGQAGLHEIHRQRQSHDRALVHDAAAGNLHGALESLARRGLLTVAPKEQDAAPLLARAWAENERHAVQQALVLCGTRADARTLNRLCQDQRLTLGDLPAGEFLRHGDERLHVGDRVLLTANNRALRVRNGQFGTIVALAPRLHRIAVQIDDGERVVLPLRDYSAVQLGYAVTAHKGRGATVENAYVLAGGGLQTREIGYIQLSRARGLTRVFIDAPTAGREFAQRAERTSRSQRSLLVRSPQRSPEPTHGLHHEM